MGFVAVCSVTLARGDAAGDLYKQGIDSQNAGQYVDAAKAFDQIITGYPNTPNIDDVRLHAGFAYLHAGDFPNAIDRLSKELNSKTGPEYRAMALYLTGLAQFSQAQKATDAAQKKAAFTAATTTFGQLIDYIPKNPTPENQSLLEDTIYYRALAEFQTENYPAAEKDLLRLLNEAPFSQSTKRPDYLLLLGGLYAVQTNQAVASKQTPDAIKAQAQKALDRYDQVSKDPNALVQANDADMSKAEVLYLIAQLDAAGAGYDKALQAYRLVRRKDDMIQIQQNRLDQLKKQSAAALSNAGAGGVSLSNENFRLIERETGRLKQLTDGPDPIIQALIRIAECYNAMKPPQADEARVVLRRLSHAQLTPEQQQEVDFQLLNSYVLGGQLDKVDAALTEYRSKHPDDTQADGISYQLAAKLLDKKDYEGALKAADRSLADYPKGRFLAEVHSLKASAYKSLGQPDKAQEELKLAANGGGGALAVQNQLTLAQTMAAQGDLKNALETYQKVKDNAAAGELQSYGASGYINTLQALGRYDDVIKEAQAFASKYPTSKALPGVLVYGALAMDKKNDPAAIAALQDVAKKYPTDEAAPFALFYVVNIYQRNGNVAGMTQAAKDLQAAYPTAYAFLAQADDAVGAAYVKEKKFDDAVAIYQPLLTAPKPEIAASAQNKVGGVWLAAAKAVGPIQSLPAPARIEPQKKLDNAQDAYIAVLSKYPDQVSAVGDAFQGLYDVLKQRRSWGLLTDADMDAYLSKITAALTTPDMQARVELAKAGLVFLIKNGDKQYTAALDSFKKVIGANSALVLTRQEASQYGELLLGAQQYPQAIDVFNKLLATASADDVYAQADAYYGLGATYLAQGDVAKAAENFNKMKALPGGAAWHPHIMEANYGLALASEQAGDPTSFARKTYGQLMQATTAGIPLQAKAIIGYGRLLEKEGLGVAPAVKGTIEYAVHYFEQVDLLYGAAVPDLSAEGLYDAGQAYEKAGDKANAKAEYQKLLTNYGKTAPDWAAKAQAALGKL